MHGPGRRAPTATEAVAASPAAAAAPGWLNRTLLGVGLTSLFSDWGHELATSLMPALLTSLGAPPIALGVVEGLSDAASTGMKLAGGAYGDRIANRKPLLVLGYLATPIMALFAIVTAWWQVVTLRTVAWAGRGLRNPLRDSLLADATPPTAYGRAFGFHRGMDTLGAVLGPLTGTLLLPVLGLRHAFWISTIPGALSVLCVAILVREPPRHPDPTLRFRTSLRRLPAQFRWFLGSAGVFGMGNYAHTFLVLYAQTVLTPSLGAARAAAVAVGLYTLHNALYAVGSFPAGFIADRLGKRGLLVTGYALFAAMNLVLIAPGAGLMHLVFAFVLAGIYIALVDAMEGAMAADLLPPEVRSTGYGVLAAVNGIGDLVSGLAVGGLWTAFGARPAFVYAAVLTLGGAALLGRVRAVRR
ncbi:MAG: MFS transporter [Armatimonadota bacterium]|nr:MFS transporter [Armatimonadota bacterium]MDR7485112.1 MFS transporter [Armatimonadota bacterium]MDR7533500.1 MFS transporter [Armatimonadota bacterium]MDR7536999.1 MFS transporter [Armatimonadota bacterium]